MSKMTNIACAAALAVGAASAAQALTLTSPGVQFTPNINDQFSVIFDTMPQVNQTSGSFQIGFDFDLEIDWDNGGNSSIGYFVDQGTTRLVTSTAPTTCSGTSGPESCDLRFSFDAPSEEIAADLPSGFFTFGVFGTSTQAPSTLTFTVTKVAAVPLPAAGLMLIGAMGGLAAMRRRTKSG